MQCVKRTWFRVPPINAVALRCGRRRTGSMVAARLVTLLPFSVSPSTWYHVLSHCYHRGFLVCYHVSSWLNERVARRSCDRGEHLEGFANKILWNILNSKMTSVSTVLQLRLDSPLFHLIWNLTLTINKL